nr:RHS repeat-associated core domain-containing protein [Streptomyces sp. WM6373]
MGRRTAQSLVGQDGRTLQRRGYSYRADGYLTGIEDIVTGSRSFTLDAAARVTAVDAASWSERYAYDEAGNQTSTSWPPQHPHREAQGARTYAGTRIIRAGSIRYEHDALGRVTLRQKSRLSRKPDTWRYEWNAENQLTGVTTPDGTRWCYQYDPLGRRTAKQRLAQTGEVAEETLFTWDGTTLCEETSGAVTLTWTHQGLHPLTQAERIDQSEVDDRFFVIVTDLIGTPTHLLAEDGTTAWHTRSTLWGSTTWNRDATAYTPLRFPGQYCDPESGLHHNYFRTYDPETARYLTPDPLGLTPSPNPAAYVHNPLTWSDRLGLAPDGCPDLGEAWKPLDIKDPKNWNGCEDVAVKIQEQLGGGVRYRISNAIPNPLAEAYSMGPYRGTDPIWFHHDVVVYGDRVYDGFTGRHGLPRAEYDALWSPDYLDILHWRPLD